MTIDLELFTISKMHIVSHKVQSTVTDGTSCQITVFTGCPIIHSQWYLMGHKEVLR